MVNDDDDDGFFDETCRYLRKAPTIDTAGIFLSFLFQIIYKRENGEKDRTISIDFISRDLSLPSSITAT